MRIKEIHERLLFRRLGNGGVRLIDQSNSWENLLEHIATGGDASVSFGKSSYLLQMLLEICSGDNDEYGDSLAEALYSQVIIGENPDGSSLEFPEKIDLYSWVPPKDWAKNVLKGNVSNEGISLSIHSFYSTGENTSEPVVTKVQDFIKTSRTEHPFELNTSVPLGTLILACIRHKSPIPPEFWRHRLACCNEQTNTPTAKISDTVDDSHSCLT